MRLACAAVFVCAVCVFAGPAHAAQRTLLTVEAPTLPGGAPLAVGQPRYSQAVSVVVHLALEDGTPIGGTVCSPACSVIVNIGPADGGDDELIVVNPQGFVTDTAGAATARITFVDGRYREGSAFPSSADGVPYTIDAVFLGAGAGQVQTNPDCVASAVEDVDGDLCPARAAITTALFAETAEIAPALGLQGALGDELTLSAELADPNGDAALGGTDVDGAGPLLLAGRTVTFFFDVDKDGNADGDTEIVGTAETNQAGVASLAFTLDPDFIRAGEYAGGLQAEFGGDGRYGVARAGSRVVVRPADVDVARTILEVTAATLPADGVAQSTITVRLVDLFNNTLDETSEAHDVVITANDVGLLLDSIALDLLTGVYTQVLQARRIDGTVTIGVTVDGVTAPATVAIVIEGAGGCRCSSAASAPSLVGLCLLLVALRARGRLLSSRSVTTRRA